MILHKRLAAILATSLILTSTPVMTFANDYDTHWAREAITRWKDRDVVEGFEDGTFRPNDTITNAQFAQIMVKLKGYEATEGGTTFSDVEADKWYSDAIAKISAAGIMHETGSTFNPDDGISREATTFALKNAFQLESNGKERVTFIDEDQVSDWAADSVQTLNSLGYIIGNPDGSFNPQGTLTRAEFITILDRINTYIDSANIKEVIINNTDDGVTGHDNSVLDSHVVEVVNSNNIQSASNHTNSSSNVYNERWNQGWHNSDNNRNTGIGNLDNNDNAGNNGTADNSDNNDNAGNNGNSGNGNLNNNGNTNNGNAGNGNHNNSNVGNGNHNNGNSGNGNLNNNGNTNNGNHNNGNSGNGNHNNGNSGNGNAGNSNHNNGNAGNGNHNNGNSGNGNLNNNGNTNNGNAGNGNHNNGNSGNGNLNNNDNTNNGNAGNGNHNNNGNSGNDNLSNNGNTGNGNHNNGNSNNGNGNHNNGNAGNGNLSNNDNTNNSNAGNSNHNNSNSSNNDNLGNTNTTDDNIDNNISNTENNSNANDNNTGDKDITNDNSGSADSADNNDNSNSDDNTNGEDNNTGDKDITSDNSGSADSADNNDNSNSDDNTNGEDNNTGDNSGSDDADNTGDNSGSDDTINNSNITNTGNVNPDNSDNNDNTNNEEISNNVVVNGFITSVESTSIDWTNATITLNIYEDDINNDDYHLNTPVDVESRITNNSNNATYEVTLPRGIYWIEATVTINGITYKGDTMANITENNFTSTNIKVREQSKQFKVEYSGLNSLPSDDILINSIPVKNNTIDMKVTKVRQLQSSDVSNVEGYEVKDISVNDDTITITFAQQTVTYTIISSNSSIPENATITVNKTDANGTQLTIPALEKFNIGSTVNVTVNDRVFDGIISENNEITIDYMPIVRGNFSTFDPIDLSNATITLKVYKDNGASDQTNYSSNDLIETTPIVSNTNYEVVLPIGTYWIEATSIIDGITYKGCTMVDIPENTDSIDNKNIRINEQINSFKVEYTDLKNVPSDGIFINSTPVKNNTIDMRVTKARQLKIADVSNVEGYNVTNIHVTDDTITITFTQQTVTYNIISSNTSIPENATITVNETDTNGTQLTIPALEKFNIGSTVNVTVNGRMFNGIVSKNNEITIDYMPIVRGSIASSDIVDLSNATITLKVYKDNGASDQTNYSSNDLVETTPIISNTNYEISLPQGNYWIEATLIINDITYKGCIKVDIPENADLIDNSNIELEEQNKQFKVEYSGLKNVPSDDILINSIPVKNNIIDMKVTEANQLKIADVSNVEGYDVTDIHVTNDTITITFTPQTVTYDIISSNTSIPKNATITVNGINANGTQLTVPVLEKFNIGSTVSVIVNNKSFNGTITSDNKIRIAYMPAQRVGGNLIIPKSANLLNDNTTVKVTVFNYEHTNKISCISYTNLTESEKTYWVALESGSYCIEVTATSNNNVTYKGSKIVEVIDKNIAEDIELNEQSKEFTVRYEGDTPTDKISINSTLVKNNKIEMTLTEARNLTASDVSVDGYEVQNVAVENADTIIITLNKEKMITYKLVTYMPIKFTPAIKVIVNDVVATIENNVPYVTLPELAPGSMVRVKVNGDYFWGRVYSKNNNHTIIIQ